MQPIIALLPTYNEAENIKPLIEQLLELNPALEVLVVDDDSPDLTWHLVQEMARTTTRVHVLRRLEERGRGTAGIAGFKEALQMGAQLVIEMDADFSHHPRFIPPMLAEIEKGTDLVIGSRLVSGGGERRHSRFRYLTTRLANRYIRLVLGLPYRDCTSGFRIFRRHVLEAIKWDNLLSQGPEIVQEVLLAAHTHGFTIREVPIIFEERLRGRSTFNSRIMVRSLWAMIKFRRRRSVL